MISLFYVVELFLADGEGEQFLQGAVEDVAVDDVLLAGADTADVAYVGVLPESPLAAVFEFVDIVVCNPVGVVVEDGVVEVLRLEGVAGVDDGFDSVVLLDDVEPFLDGGLELFIEELKKAGIDRIVEENRRQLSLWLSEQGR